MSKKNLVEGIVCLKCKDEIWSRHRHDFRYCKCGSVAVDGGREYLRIIGEREGLEIIQIDITADLKKGTTGEQLSKEYLECDSTDK